MDKLEKFIKENRHDLDRHEPDQAIWTRIQKGKPEPVRLFTFYFLRAAMLIFIIASSLVIYSVTSDGAFTGGDHLSSHPGLSPELVETEVYYTSITKELLEQTKPFLASNPALEAELMIEITRLDNICDDIRNDLKDNISNQEVIEALVMNYRIKVRLLEDMLDVLRNDENKNNDNNVHHEL